MNSVLHAPDGVKRHRKDGYAVTERAAGLADLLHLVVVKLDCGTAPFDLSAEVAAIAKAMRS